MLSPSKHASPHIHTPIHTYPLRSKYIRYTYWLLVLLTGTRTVGEGTTTGGSQSQKTRGREAAEGMTNAFFNYVRNTTSFPVHTLTACLNGPSFLDYSSLEASGGSVK